MAGVTDSISAVVATLVAIAFCLSTLERYLARRSLQEIAWTLSLGMFALAAAALAIGASAGWTSATYRVFYLFGGVVNVPFLATGTIAILFGRRAGVLTLAGVSLFSAFAAGVIVMAPMHGVLPRHTLAQASKVLPGLPELLAGLGSGIASVVLVGGALYSAVRIRRGRLLWTNVFIAIGTLVTGASGILNSAFDKMTAFSISLSVGIMIIFIGFLLSGGTPNAHSEYRPGLHEAALSESPIAHG
jgi:MFS family permease